MTIREDIKIILLREKLTLVDLAKMLSIKARKNITPDSISQKLRKSTIKFDEVKEIFDCLDYDVIFQKRN